NAFVLRLQAVRRSTGLLSSLNSANVLGGANVNLIYSGVLGGTVSGGGMNAQSFIFGTPYPNIVSDDFGTIGGGINNTLGNTNVDLTDVRAGTVSGGESNLVTATYATIAGGFNNFIQPNSDAASIGGGRNNVIQNNSLLATISGGEQNSIETGAVAST